MLDDNRARWTGQRPFYEVWFLKLNHAQSGGALWVRYTTLAARDGTTRGEVWAIAFAKGGPHRAGHRAHPREQVTHGADPLIRIGDAELADGRARGEVADIEWELEWTPNASTFHHVPSWLAGLGVLSSQVCSPNVDVAVRGWFRVGPTMFVCNGEAGQQGHIWGRRYGHRWSWAHCNTFRGAPGAVFEGVTAQLALGAIVTPPLTSAFVRWRGRDRVFNGVRDMLWTPSAHRLGSWTFTLDDGGHRFVGAISAATRDMVGVAYTDTDSTKLYCHNAKIGSMTLEVLENRGGAYRPVERLESEGATALEYTDRAADPAVPILVG